MSHTPGPWIWEEGYYGLRSEDSGLRSEDSGWILRYADYEGMWLDGNEDANARLIAVAPEMFYALCGLANHFRAKLESGEGGIDDREELEALEKLIAKAEGK